MEIKNVKENMKLIEKTEEQDMLDLSVLEEENKKHLEDISKENQKVFFSPGNNLTKQHILTNLYTNLMIPFNQKKISHLTGKIWM